MAGRRPRVDVWTEFLDVTDHPSRRRVTRYAAMAGAAAFLFVGALAFLGLFSGGPWWAALGLACVAVALLLR